jgi:glycine/D-amino acid oxidase-like deaminating enzyme
MRLRVVAVGGGIMWVIAFHLQYRGASVTLLDADEVTPKRASRASFAWMNAKDKNTRAYHDLSRRSLDI